MRSVFLDQIDISKFVIDVPNLTSTAAEIGQVSVEDITSLEGDLSRGFWDAENPNSPFFGALSLQSFPITIKQDGETVFDGNLQSIQSDYKTSKANVTLRSKTKKILDSKIIYFSQGNVTPAAAAKDLCATVGLDINATSFGISHNIYLADNVLCTVSIKQPTPVSQILQNIANIGVARIYINQDEVGCDVYQTRTDPALFTFSDKSNAIGGITIYGHPAINPIEREKAKGYRVEWVQNPAAVLGTESQRSISISGGADQSVRISSIQAAIWIGERWFAYTNSEESRVTIGIPLSYSKSLNIGYPIAVSYQGTDYIMDIVQIDNSNRVMGMITGVVR